jgi:hypothetical protein
MLRTIVASDTMIRARLGLQRAATRQTSHGAGDGNRTRVVSLGIVQDPTMSDLNTSAPRATVRTAIWVSMDTTGYDAAETLVMLAWVPTTDLVGMK